MPAPRKPTKILEMQGAYKKNPQRAKARENEPVVHGDIGPPPDCFMPKDGFDGGSRPEYRALWHELIADAAPGVLNRSHRWWLETACRMKFKERHGTAKTGDTAALQKALAGMGMNPAAQSTVNGGAFTPAGGTSALGKLAARAQSRRTG